MLAANKALLLSRLKAHIRGVVGHYGTDIATWDVVNEVIDENQADGLRRSRWYEIAGLDYIRTAFRVTREVAPAAKLYINDYNTNVPAKRDKLHDLVSQLKAEGVPIDGVGHQMHVNVDWPSVRRTGTATSSTCTSGIPPS
jgi:endo-1,4-beta-xylanase